MASRLSKSTDRRDFCSEGRSPWPDAEAPGSLGSDPGAGGLLRLYAASLLRSARGSVRCFPSTLSTVLPLTTRACVASHSLPTAVAERHGVAGELDHDVAAGRAVERVVAGAADQHVVAGAAQEGVVAVAADEHVVAVAAVGGEQQRARGQAGGVDDVVARPAR